MRFIISHPELSKLLSKTQNIVQQKPTTPILANLLIEAASGVVTITSTDLLIGIRCKTEAKILEEGKTTLPARKFAQLIRELSTPHIEIHTNSQEITEVIAGESRFKLNGMSTKEYPTLPELEKTMRLTMPRELLRDLLARTAFAVSREDNRYALTGVLFKLAGGILTLVGTDGKRLAKHRVKTAIDSSLSSDAIIPLKTVEEIIKTTEGTGDVQLYLMQDKIAIDAGDTLLVSKLLSGEYPDVERIIPQQLDRHITLHRDELATLLRQISLFTPDSATPVRFSFTNGELKISANSMEIGEGHVAMPVNYSGERLDIAFNPGYFLDILRHTKKETLDLGVIDAYSPVILREEAGKEQNETADSLCLLMPMRLEV